MNITTFGIAALIAPFLFGGGAFMARRNRGLFILLVILTILAVIVALLVLNTVGGYTTSTSGSQ